MFSKTRILLVGAACALTLIGCGSKDAVQTAAPAKDAVAATVNGTPIGEGLVRLMLKQRTDLGREASAEARKSFIDRLAMQLVISQEAIKKGLDKTPEVSDQIELIRQSVLVDAFIQDYIKSNTISDDALKAEYEKMKAQAAGTEYKARHILVEKESEAKDIIARLKKNPKAFEALAKEKSKDPGSKVKGGDLGWFDPRGMVPEFGAAVAKLEKGKFTEEPVKSQFGYHVILLDDSRPLPVQSLEEIKPALTRHLQEQNLKKLFDELKAKAKIEITQTSAPAPAPVPPPAASPAQETKPAEPAKK
jgi:peptidyl-prolyl cis-trans isomerase C